MWGWANPSIEADEKKEILEACEFGKQKGWEIFEEPKIPASGRDAYALTALIASELGAEGVYIGDSGGTLICLLLNNIQKEES